MSPAVDRLTDLGFAAGWSLVKTLPEPVADRIFRQAADTAFRRRGPSVVQLAKNLHRVLGEQSTPESLSAVVQAGMRSYARYWKETFRLPAMDHDEVFAQLEAGVIGAEHIERAVAEGRGIVLPLTHSGNWDAAGLWVTRRWGSLTTVAERLKPESLYEQFVAYRESLGMQILPLTGGENPTTVLRERLKHGAIVPLVGDRDLSKSGVPVTFFGETATMPPGPVALAALTDSYLCPTNLNFTADAGLGDPYPSADDAARHPAVRAGPRRHPAGRRRSSSGASASTPPTGTCCSRCGGRTWTIARPAAARRRVRNRSARGDGHEGRPGLPVLLRHPRRGAGARRRPGQDADQPRPSRVRARAG